MLRQPDDLQQKENEWLTLPEEVMIYTLSFLNPSELTPISHSCRLFNHLAKNTGLRAYLKSKKADFTVGSPQHEYIAFDKRQPCDGLCAVLYNRFLVALTDSKTLGVFDIKTREYLRSLEGHTQKINALLTLSTNLVASASDDGTIAIWNTETGTRLKIISDDPLYKGCIKGMVALTSTSIAYVSVNPQDDARLSILDLNTGNVTRTYDLPTQVSSFRGVINVSTDQLVLWHTNNLFYFLDLKSGASTRHVASGEIQSIKKVSASKLLIHAHTKGIGMLNVLDIITKQTETLDISRMIAFTATVIPLSEQEILCTYTILPMYRIWNIETRKCLATIEWGGKFDLLKDDDVDIRSAVRINDDSVLFRFYGGKSLLLTYPMTVSAQNSCAPSSHAAIQGLHMSKTT